MKTNRAEVFETSARTLKPPDQGGCDHPGVMRAIKATVNPFRQIRIGKP
jgi:hypothetical protein